MEKRVLSPGLKKKGVKGVKQQVIKFVVLESQLISEMNALIKAGFH